MGNRTYDYTTKATHVVGGVEGEVAGWTMTGALTVSRGKQETNYLNGFPLADEFTAGMEAQLFDPFPYVLGTMPAAQLDALKATQYRGNYSTNQIDMTGVDANAQHSLFNLAGGDAIISVGADYRRNTYDQVPNSAVANAEILFDDPQPSFDLSRNGWGVYGEFLAPVTKTLEFTAAARFDQISGVDDKITDTRLGDSESATTYKIGGKWQAMSSLALRASFGTGFRTASMREIAQPRIDFGVTSGTYDCPFNAGYDPLGYFAANYVCADGLQFEVYQGGNPSLKPEKSQQWNVGLIWQPVGAFSAGLNFWSVEIEDSVTSVSEQLIMENPAKYLSLYTTKFKISNGLTYVAILDAPINIGRVENEGLDWDFTYEHDVGIGMLRGTVAGTHLTKSRYTIPGTDDVWTTSLNKFGVNDAVSFRDVITATATHRVRRVGTLADRFLPQRLHGPSVLGRRLRLLHGCRRLRSRRARCPQPHDLRLAHALGPAGAPDAGAGNREPVRQGSTVVVARERRWPPVGLRSALREPLWQDVQPDCRIPSVMRTSAGT